VHVKTTFLPPILQKQCHLKLFKQSTALLQTINCRKHQANNQQEQSKAPLTVWYEIHTTADPTQQPNPISTSKKQSMGACEGTFLPPILQKQCSP
jgi:hypothetical protein